MTGQREAGPTRVCLTPTRNEAWIIDRFVRAAAEWADEIILADQQSDDGTAESASRTCSKVRIIPNDCPAYDEVGRQRLLLRTARETTAGPRVLLALDADEAVSANFRDSEQWRRAAGAEPGTVLRFRWANVLPGFETCWIPPDPIAFGFVDDGRGDHDGSTIHSRRLPWPAGAPVIDVEDVVVLHFQYVAWDRMRSKQRWYQAWERLNFPKKRPVQIFRQYNHMLGWPGDQMHPVRPEWLAGYDEAGIDFRSLAGESAFWWDREVLEMFAARGWAPFRKLDIWDADWTKLAAAQEDDRRVPLDPRSAFDRAVHRFLRLTQSRQSTWAVRGVQQLIRLFGW